MRDGFEAAPGTERYAIEEHREGADYLIRLSGDLEPGSHLELEAALLAAEDSDADRIVLDIDGLRFIDSLGLSAIVRAHRRCADQGDRFWVTRPTGHVADLFRLTALDRTLRFT